MKSFAAPGRHVVVFATLAFAAVLIAGTLLAGRVAADGMQGAIERAAQVAPQIIDQRRGDGSPDPASAAARDLIAMGVHVDIRGPGTPPGAGPPGPPALGPPPRPDEGPGGPPRPGPPRANPQVQIAIALFGLRPREVRDGDIDLVIAPDAPRLLATLWAFIWTLLALISLYGVAAVFLARAAAQSALRPLHETTRALRELAGGNFVPRMIVADEALPTAELARAYNAAAEQVAAAIEERKSAEAEMRRFLADAGHELRTPLTIVGGYIDLLENGSSDPALHKRIVTGMREETLRMRALVEKLLLLVRLESTQTQTEAVDVAGIARSVVQRLSAVAGSRDIELETPPAAHVRGDASDLYEALFNLVDNAIKYGKQSDVSVRVAAKNEGVEITVKDGGPGLDAEEQRHAFERFYRGAQRAEVEGSGLGLAIVKRAIERCNGTIELTSRPGEGATFVIALPRESAAPA